MRLPNDRAASDFRQRHRRACFNTAAACFNTVAPNLLQPQEAI